LHFNSKKSMKKHKILNKNKARVESMFSRNLRFDDIKSVYLDEFKISQEEEYQLRLKVVNEKERFVLDEIAKHHFVDLMDIEVNKFLMTLPNDAIVLDVGGGWGWHWRNLHNIRPDVVIVIVDFVANNLYHVSDFCSEKSLKNIFLINADATSLPFIADSFDAYWSVQTLQHIPDFSSVIYESYRVLKQNGKFINYTLNGNLMKKIVYVLFFKKPQSSVYKRNLFYLSLASPSQRNLISNVFNNRVVYYFSEHLFHPNLMLTFKPYKSKFIAHIDLLLSRLKFFGRLFARQQVYITYKK